MMNFVTTIGTRYHGLGTRSHVGRRVQLAFPTTLRMAFAILFIMSGATALERPGALRRSIAKENLAVIERRAEGIVEGEWIETSEVGIEEELKDIEWVEEPETIDGEGKDVEIVPIEVAIDEDEIFEKQEAEEFDEEFEIQQIRERILPIQDLECSPDGGRPKQFAHLHHMKTGGTSLNKAIGCALQRAQKTHNQQYIPYYSFSECSWSRFQKCMAGDDDECTKSIDKAMAMQFCAPLFAVNHFDWLEANLVTVLRHPVDRVWSMYRFQTKSCYKCHSLLETFQRIENGTTPEICGKCEGVCMTQLSNHLVRNLLTTDPLTLDEAMTDQEMLDEAIWNMKHRVALVGVTEQLDVTWAMMGKAFPWLNATSDRTDMVCELSHENKTPKNNRCGPNNSHLELPSEPDDELKEMILKHNQLDLQLYQEAARWFELQKRALGFAQE